MDIKVPAGKSTISIVIGGTMTGDEKANKMNEKRMDLLEKKLDQQYKRNTSGIDPQGFVKKLDQIQSSFAKKLKEFVVQSKQTSTNQEKLLEAFKKSISKKVQVIKQESSGNDELKTFIKKISSLEEAIKKISVKPQVTVNRSVNLGGAFEKMFVRFEKLIKEAKPRVYPSPS